MCGVCVRRGCVWGVCEEGNVLNEVGVWVFWCMYVVCR